mgnify:CR=1 FL=1
MAHDHKKTHDEIRFPDDMDLLERAIRELLIEKGVFSEDDFSNQLLDAEKTSPADGAKVVARAWSNASYKKSLLGVWIKWNIS